MIFAYLRAFFCKKYFAIIDPGFSRALKILASECGGAKLMETDQPVLADRGGGQVEFARRFRKTAVSCGHLKARVAH
jgi:hypothetical protein